MPLLLHLAQGESSLYWHWHPDVMALCAFLLAGYWYAVTQLRDVISDAGRVKRSQVALYVSGVACIYVATSSPIHEISEDYLASVHMVQHMLYTLIAPPLLIAADDPRSAPSTPSSTRVYWIGSLSTENLPFLHGTGA